MGDREYGMIEDMLPLLVSNGKGNFTSAQIEAFNKFKKFIDHLPGGFLIYRADKSEEIIYANKALIRIFECADSKEFIAYTGNTFKGIVYREDYEEVVNSIEHQILTGGDNLDYVEYRILTKKGNIRQVEDYGHFLRTNVGDIYYVFITDSTDKTAKRQQERLQKLEVIEGLSLEYDSILYADLDADRITPYRMSKRLTKQFDGEIKAKSYSWVIEDFVKSWVHPDDQQRIRNILSPDYIRKMLSQSRTFYANFNCLFGDEIQYMQLRIVDAKNYGRISHIIIGSRNIGDELEQERQKKTLLENALKEAKIANIAKNSFLSNISHDMRTPLNALFGYTELAKKHIDDKEIIARHLQSVSDAGKQLLDLVDKVLEISYLESQDFHLNEELCNLEEVVAGIYDEVAPVAKKKNINFTLEHRGILHPEVYADVEQLKQILLNLATNAVKYTGNGGTVNFIMEESVSPSAEFVTYRFVVHDTGVGIAQEALEKIFEPFEREYNSTLSGVFGSGLGLTIAKQIIDSMGGTITAESQVGVGSIFTVNLSFKLPKKQETSASADDVDEFIKGKKLLLVEDNEINLEIETELLEDLGLIVEPAENGKIAVDKMAVAKPDEYLFVLMDIQMPVMDGWQATEGIRALPDPAIANIPIIALSANAFESDKRLSAKNGMNAHLNKPLNIDNLLHAIEKTVMNK